MPAAVVCLFPVDLALLRRGTSMGRSQASITLVASATERSHAALGTGTALTLLLDQGAWSCYTSCMRTEKLLENEEGLTEGFTALVSTITECYLTVTFHSFSGILHDGRLLMVFYECIDFSMLRNQLSPIFMVCARLLRSVWEPYVAGYYVCVC